MDTETGRMPNNCLAHGKVVHQLEHRIRVVSPILLKDTERAYILEILLKKRDGIVKVKTVPDIASVAIHFDPRRLPKASLLTLLDNLLGNLGQKTPHASYETVQEPAIEGNVRPREIHLTIEGMTCVSCALLIEMLLNRDPRIDAANVNFATETATVTGRISEGTVCILIGRIGYRAQSYDSLAQRKLLVEREEKQLQAARRRALLAGALSLPLMAIGMLAPASRFWHWTQHLLAMPVVLWAGLPFFGRAFKLARQGATNMDSLIAIGVGSAYVYSLTSLLKGRPGLYFDSASGILTFVLIGRYLEEKAKGKAHEAIRALVSLQPQNACVLRKGTEFSVPLANLRVGDLAIVRPGERIPADGLVIEGFSNVDESMVSGESLPVARQSGDSVVGGCINGNGLLKIEITAIGADTVLSNIIHMVDQAQSSKLPIQKSVDRIASVFVPSVMAVAAATSVYWLAVGAPFSIAFVNAIAVLLIACPCSLGLATPMAIMVGTGESARRGVYIRNGESLELASKLTTIVFDKTGTITEGKPKVTDFIALPGLPEDRLLALAAAAESGSEHFLAKTLVSFAHDRQIAALAVEAFENLPGHGIKARIDGCTVMIGNRRWFEDSGIGMSGLSVQETALSEQGKTPVYLGVNGSAMALFGIADRPRATAKDAIGRLRTLGIEPWMVTGDTEQTARFIAEQVGIKRVIAHARPERKLEIIRELQSQGAKVGMIGDGINDAPAIAAADVSFAVGTGTDVAIETADLILVGGDIGKIAEVMELSGDTLRIIKQNLFWALGYNTVAIPVAALGKLNPMIASATMAFSSISVVLNSLRLQRR